MFKKSLMGVMAVAVLTLPSLAYAQAYGSVATETLNVREGAKLDSSIVEQIGLGEYVEVVSAQGDWLKIILEDDSRGYIKSEYVAVHRALAVVDASAINVRDYPSEKNGEIIGRFEEGDEISIHFKVDDWYKISDGEFEGYVHSDYIKNSSDIDFLSLLPTKKLTDIKKCTMTQEEALAKKVKAEEVIKQQQQNTNNNSESANAGSDNASSNNSNSSSNSDSSSSSNSYSGSSSVVEYAKQFLGNPYVYGGSSLTNGTDCSGFTSQIMAHFGVSISRNSAAQYANDGYYVSSDQLAPGDLVFYGYNGRVSHVAMYIGGGQIIHANDERTGICIGNLYPSSSGAKQYIGAKRVLN